MCHIEICQFVSQTTGKKEREEGALSPRSAAFPINLHGQIFGPMQLPQCFCCTYTFAAREAYVHDLRGIATRGNCRETLDVFAIIQRGNPELCGNGLASLAVWLVCLFS